MARALTSDELILYRSDGPWTKLYLAVLHPHTIYTARLASLPSSTDNVHTISVNTESGTLANVKVGMTVYVGTSAGAHDLGMCRIRKTPITGTWYIGLTSQIDWQGTCHLTIVDDFDLWAKHAMLDSSVLKMDVDVAYSDQHANFNPVPVLRGRELILWLTGATVSQQLNANDSWVFSSSISGYSWSAPGASATSGMTTVTPTITYNAAGEYRVYCTVTAANGKSTEGVICVWVFDANNMPATVFQLAQCVGDYDTGGWMFDLTMEDEASLSEIRDRSLVVLFAEDWYGLPEDVTKQSIGPIAGKENIVCVGRIVGESIRWDRDEGFVHFTVQGLHHWLNRIDSFPVQLQPVTAAGNWSQMPHMNVDHVLWHILYWHSTAIETMDFYRSGENSRYTPDSTSMASTLWGQLADIAFSKIFASPGVDRFGRLFVEVDPQMVPEDDRDFPTVMTLTEDDWQDGIDLQRVTVEDVSVIRLSSLHVNTSAHSETLYSLSPGHTPRRYGDPYTVDRVLSASQAGSNQLAGLLLGWRTNDLPDVPVVLLQNNRMFDLFPRQYAAVEVATGDTPRGVAYDVRLIPRHISLYFDNETGFMHPEINFEGESFEQPSVNGDVPEVGPLPPGPPPIPPPPILPPPPIIPPGPGGFGTEGGPPKIVLHDSTVGLLYSENFNEASPEWITINAGLTEAQYQGINRIVITPSGGIYVAWLITTGSGEPFIAYASSPGATFTIIEDQTTIAAKFPGSSIKAVVALGVDPLAGQAAYVIGGELENPKIYVGSGLSFAAGASIPVHIGSRGSLSYGQGVWRLSGQNGGQGNIWIISAGGGSIVTSLGSLGVFTHQHKPISTTDELFHIPYIEEFINWADGNGLTNITARGSLIKLPIGATDLPDNVLACDPTGMFLMSQWDVGSRGKSSDGGATWSGIPSLFFGGEYVFEYCGATDAESRWIAARGVVYYSPDFGTTWENKQGNITLVVPFPNINIVRLVEP